MINYLINELVFRGKNIKMGEKEVPADSRG
jgi:hypothetical protein